jgi:hypothetical protein
MDDVQKLLNYVNRNLSYQLKNQELADEYYYQSLTLATIDAIYSAQARYPSVQNVINRYCRKYELTKIRSSRTCLPQIENRESVNSLILKIEKVGCQEFAENVFENQSRTSGRLKAEILLELLKVIQSLNIESFQEVQPWLTQPDKQHELLSKITKIHGIGKATSRYFLMLSGDDQMVKPDTMILRFVRNAIGRKIDEIDAVLLIQAVSRRLLPDYPKINPRLLDYLIWSWQRDQPNSGNFTSSRQGRIKIRISEQKQNKNIKPSKREEAMTIPQKTQQAMHRRYQSGELLSSSQIKDDVLTDYPDTLRDSVMPPDYCCNKWNKDPASGIYHVFFFEKNLNKYRLLPKLDITKPRQRGECP